MDAKTNHISHNINTPEAGYVRVGPIAAIPDLLRAHASETPEQILAELDIDRALFDDPENLLKIIREMQGEVGAYIFRAWHFPESMIDQVIVELHKTDRSKVVADQTAVIRILSYIEAFLRISCRTIPWKTLFEINNELGMNIDKNQIAAAKFQAIQKEAYQNYLEKGMTTIESSKTIQATEAAQRHKNN